MIPTCTYGHKNGYGYKNYMFRWSISLSYLYIGIFTITIDTLLPSNNITLATTFSQQANRDTNWIIEWPACPNLFCCFVWHVCMCKGLHTGHKWCNTWGNCHFVILYKIVVRLYQLNSFKNTGKLLSWKYNKKWPF